MGKNKVEEVTYLGDLSNPEKVIEAVKSSYPKDYELATRKMTESELTNKETVLWQLVDSGILDYGLEEFGEPYNFFITSKQKETLKQRDYSREYMKKYRQENKQIMEKGLEKLRAYRANLSKEELRDINRESARVYREKNREAYNEYQRQYQKAKPKKLKKENKILTKGNKILTDDDIQKITTLIRVFNYQKKTLLKYIVSREKQENEIIASEGWLSVDFKVYKHKNSIAKNREIWSKNFNNNCFLVNSWYERYRESLGEDILLEKYLTDYEEKGREIFSFLDGLLSKTVSQ